MSGLREALEDAIVADPDDLSSHMAYADYLSEQGDPRGEFITVQLALEDEGLSPPAREELQRRERELFEQHGRAWLGELAPWLLDHEDVPDRQREQGRVTRFRLVRGWLDRVEIPYLSEAHAEFLKMPSARCLRHLSIDTAGDADEADEKFPQLAGAPFLRCLRSFRFGIPHKDEYNPHGIPHGELYDPCWAFGNSVVELLREMPRLEELRLFAVLNEVGSLYFSSTFGHLRVLQIHHATAYYLTELADNDSLVNLTHLLLMPHAVDPGGESRMSLGGVFNFLHSPAAEKLTHLQLRMAPDGDAIVSEIIDVGLLRQLEVLDLRHGSVRDRGAMLLAACPDTRRLRRLDLARNQLTERGIAALEALGLPDLRLGHQQEPDEQGRYGDEYLYDGDWE